MNAAKVVEWLKEVSVLPLDYAVPVKVTLGKFEFEGARYGVKEVYLPTERACTEGIVPAGEPYVTHRFYLLGGVPRFKRAHVCFTWTHDLPIDNRVYSSIGEWYISSYGGEKSFGRTFQLSEHLSHAYGHYKGNKIDTLERYTYLRVPMTVTPA